MKRLMISAALAAGLTLCATSSALAQEKLRLTGSGASFPAPLYLTWFKDYSKKNTAVTVDYQSKGSGAGVQDFLNKTVDFAASDSAMKKEDIAKVAEGVQLLPMTAGEIVLAYNLPGKPKDLKLPRDVYSNIFLGKITKWNDPKIVAANPGVALPDLPITVVRRADSSGTTAVFTMHLSAINPEFKKTLGEGNTVNWPATDKFVASPKNDGVTATVRQTPGKLPEDMVAWLSDPDGAKSYPVTSYTWMIFRKNNGDANKAKAMRDMIEYGLTDGQKMAAAMGYIPLPQVVVEQVRKAAANIK